MFLCLLTQTNLFMNKYKSDKFSIFYFQIIFNN